METLTLLYDHYNQTNDLQTKALRLRDRLFVWLLILTAFLSLYISRPQTISNFILTIIQEKYSLDLSSQLDIIQTLIWISVLYIATRYYQVCIHIERSYFYIHDLEKRIAFKTQDKFDRESSNYLNNYPNWGKMLDFIYHKLFPYLFISVLGFKLWQESGENINELFIVDLILGISAILISIYYIRCFSSSSNDPKKRLYKLRASLFSSDKQKF